MHAGSPGGPTAAQPAGRCGRLHASEWAVQALRQYSTPGHGIALTACQVVPTLADLTCSQPRLDIHGAHKLTWCRTRRHCCCWLARSRFEPSFLGVVDVQWRSWTFADQFKMRVYVSYTTYVKQTYVHANMQYQYEQLQGGWRSGWCMCSVFIGHGIMLLTEQMTVYFATSAHSACCRSQHSPCFLSQTGSSPPRWSTQQHVQQRFAADTRNRL